MKRVNIRIGPVEFDYADYDTENDVLYLYVSEPKEAEGEETPEGSCPALRAWYSTHRRTHHLGRSSDP